MVRCTDNHAQEIMVLVLYATTEPKRTVARQYLEAALVFTSLLFIAQGTIKLHDNIVP